MLLLGMLLVGVAAAFTALAIAENFAGGPGYGVTMLGQHVATLSTLDVFLAGLALALVFCLGLAMMRGGARHARHRRDKRRVARRAAEPDATPVRGDEGAAEGRPRHRHGLHLFGH
ncbi:hypothetical protein [Streptantibioticus ferralitis]|uniref:Uncharacterized protein n=1 Tax=Streptantibioticus ferralitis TaxID=236510 RepID=A0ABT5YTQ0_9ACTN|nr:hypothetical protein [Streptantibioticus ferralitis]MDF2254814.1 hypothetical protein [Streptantibioticus ferralitis]